MRTIRYVFYKIISDNPVQTPDPQKNKESPFRRVGIGTGMRAIFILGGVTFSIIARNFLLIGEIIQKLRAIFSKRHLIFIIARNDWTLFISRNVLIVYLLMKHVKIQKLK